MINSWLHWLSITREERFFCSHLYHSILGREKEFVKWLNEKLNLQGDVQFNPVKDWEVNFEVCFYRDFLKSKGETIIDYNRKHQTTYPQKRTFDLCLFSENEIVIIEAKVQQGFSLKQIEEIDLDEELVKQLLRTFGYDVKKVKGVLLYSSKYTPKEPGIKKYPNITWEELHNSDLKEKNIFRLADEKFRK